MNPKIWDRIVLMEAVKGTAQTHSQHRRNDMLSDKIKQRGGFGLDNTSTWLEAAAVAAELDDEYHLTLMANWLEHSEEASELLKSDTGVDGALESLEAAAELIAEMNDRHGREKAAAVVALVIAAHERRGRLSINQPELIEHAAGA